MAEPIYVALGETEPTSITLEDADGAIDISGCSSIALHINGKEVACSAGEATGEVSIAWDGTEFGQVGEYHGFVWLTWADGKTRRVPKPSDIVVHVVDGVAPDE